jgi:non-heme chloroperoxidase
MPFLDFHSYKIFYTDDGPHTAPVITFIHGWTCSSKIFKPQVKYFTSHGYRCITFDLLGHGQSDKPPVSSAPELYSHVGFQDCVLALLSFLGVDKTVLVGWSMGCPAAAELARRFPERVESLVLIGYTPIFILSDPNDTFPAIPPAAAELLWESVKNQFPMMYKDLVFGWFPEYTPGEDPMPEYIQTALEDTASVGGDIAEGLSRIVSPEDFRGRVPEIKTRTLLVTGGKDGATPPEAARWTYERLGGREKKIIVYEGLGHAPFVGGNTEKFNEDVAAFLQSSN